MITTKDKILLGGGAALAISLIVVGILFTPKSRTSQNNNNNQTAPVISARVVSVNPLQGQKGVSTTPQMVVTFSDSVANYTVYLKSTPSVKFSTNLSKDGQTATFSPSVNLKPNTKYSLQVLVANQPLFAWNFKTGKGTTSQENLAEIINKIRKKLPINKNGFGISFDAPDQFFVFINKAPIEFYKQKAISWFTDEGIKDIGALNINYVPQGSLLH